MQSSQNKNKFEYSEIKNKQWNPKVYETQRVNFRLYEPSESSYGFNDIEEEEEEEDE